GGFMERMGSCGWSHTRGTGSVLDGGDHRPRDAVPLTSGGLSSRRAPARGITGTLRALPAARSIRVDPCGTAVLAIAHRPRSRDYLEAPGCGLLDPFRISAGG